MSEVEARKEKVKILEDLFNKGAESQMRVIDEKLLLIDSQKDLILQRLTTSIQRLNPQLLELLVWLKLKILVK